jgi:hypothetical protein
MSCCEPLEWGRTIDNETYQTIMMWCMARKTKEHGTDHSETRELPPIAINGEEQLAILDGIYSYLMTHTRNEVGGVLSDEMVKKNDVLRAVYLRIADASGKSEELMPVEWLWLGISERISTEQLKKWSNPAVRPTGTEVQVPKTAKYLMSKMASRG